MATVYFETISQALIFEAELKGQISDGYWENSRPSNHYHAPCDADIKVDAENPRNEIFSSRNYNFAAKELVDCVGDRMIEYAKVAKLFPNEENIARLSFLADNFRQIERAYKGESCYTHIPKCITDYKIKLKEVKYILDNIDGIEYNEKELRKDLKAIKKTFNKKK